MKTKTPKKIIIFYDGSCGLCHSFVRFSLPKIRQKCHLYFSPIGGTTFKKIHEKSPKTTLPDSIVVYKEGDQSLLVKSQAIIKVLGLLCQPWRTIGWILKWTPYFISDVLYDLVAKMRHRLFKKPKHHCPIMDQKWSKFFQD